MTSSGGLGGEGGVGSEVLDAHWMLPLALSGGEEGRVNVIEKKI